MLRRVLTEHRRFLILLAVVLVVNVGLYALVVYPLGARVADADQRAAAAERARQGAQREFAAAEAVATGKIRAETELKSFYNEVLPANVSAANRATYLSLYQMARKTNLRITRREAAVEHPRDSTLDSLRISLALEGRYEDIRRFIYELETTPTFLVIDDLEIDSGRQAGKPLVLSLSLSTYFRPADHAS